MPHISAWPHAATLDAKPTITQFLALVMQKLFSVFPQANRCRVMLVPVS